MSFNLSYAKYFCDAVKLGSITAAAKVNFVTQSAISQGIAKLEKQLGCSLLARHPNQLRLTPEGQQGFYQLVDLLRRADEIREDLSQQVNGPLGALEFATTFSIALTLLPPYLKRFCEAHPESKINLQSSGNPDEIKKRLRLGVIDFAILMDMGDFSGFEERVISKGKFDLYVASHILPQEEKKLGFILTEADDTIGLRNAYQKKFKKDPSVCIEARSWITGATLAAEGLGIGYFPDYLAKSFKGKLRPVKLGLTLPSFKLYAISLKGLKLRKSSTIFLSYFSKEFSL